MRNIPSNAWPVLFKGVRVMKVKERWRNIADGRTLKGRLN
jgi:hypothetical protein